jgi:hypothetical protein
MSFSACKRDSKGDMLPSEGQINNTQMQTAQLPFACDLVDQKKVIELLGLEVSELEVLDGNRSGVSQNSTSCFYKWSDRVYGESAIMIQVQGNPLPDELPDFVQAFIDNKKYEGERGHEDRDAVYKYDVFEGLGVQSIYNRELNRYYFAKGTDYLCSVAFNYPIDASKLDATFIEVANVMLKGF